MLTATTASALDTNMKVYGRVNISYDFLEDLDDDWVSNVSKIGVKGDYPVLERLKVVYQLEQQVDLMHGGTDIDTLLDTRNSFFGVKSDDYGRFIFGKHDTPLKMSQGKVDLFNDQLGDAKDKFVGEIRSSDSYMYNSPVIEGVQFNVMYVPSDNHFDDGQSYSLTFKKDGLYLAGAYDQDMRKNDKEAAKTTAFNSYRAVIQYDFGDLVLGGLYQSSEPQNTPDSSRESAYLVSALYDYQDFSFRAQYGATDIVIKDFNNLSLGVDYHLNKATKLYLNSYNIDVQGEKTSAVEVGFNYNF